ncbi:MAG: hypothetical protein WBN40_03290, partial [Pseudomonadales bacterium]
MAARPASIQPKPAVAAQSALCGAALHPPALWRPLPWVPKASLRFELPKLLPLLLMVLLLQGCA